jgi:cysteine dioxygenase
MIIEGKRAPSTRRNATRSTDSNRPLVKPLSWLVRREHWPRVPNIMGIKTMTVIDQIKTTVSDVMPPLRDPGQYPYSWKTLIRKSHIAGIVLNWRSKTVCLPHDHGASNASFYVIEGEAYHAIYRLNKRGVPVLDKETTEKQGATVFVPPGVVHAMGSASESPLVTLHIYSPTVSGMRIYDLEKLLAAVVSPRCGAWWPTEPGHLLKLIQLDECDNDAQSDHDSPLPAQLELPLSDDACGQLPS